jgi:pSer/pThr/pTyr-binding forkhead associated (FHA) protein
MVLCPDGHDSAGDDFCDVCGRQIGGRPASGPVRPVGKHHLVRPGAAQERPSGPPGQLDQCHVADLLASLFSPEPADLPEPPAPSPDLREPPALFPDLPEPVPVAWTISVAPDRAYYDKMKAIRGPRGLSIAFPAHLTERRLLLTGNQLRIGRRSAARDLEPEIDLAGPPADPGISRLHAVLIAGPDGGWAVLDQGSANGTLLNGREIAEGDLVPLRDGDRINLGAWTMITVHRD